jgi:hypothetical protein
MVNSRTRSRPARGRGSSRNLVWNWYHTCGSCLCDFSSPASSAKISSWVTLSTLTAPLWSVTRNMTSDIVSQRPLRCQISAGCMVGSSTSCPPIRFISSRMMPMILARTRTASGSRL